MGGTGIRSAWLTLIKHTLNHVTLAVARSRRGPFTIVRHVGRRSGSTYETPIIVQPTRGGFVIALTYGTQVNWYQNVVAAGGCTLIHHRHEYGVVGVEPLGSREAIAAFPAPQRWVLAALQRDDFALLVRGRAEPTAADRVDSSGP